MAPFLRTLLRLLAALALTGLAACRRETADRAAPDRTTVAAAKTQTAANCRECHEEIFRQWSTTDHALANRPVDKVGDAEALKTLARLAASAAEPELILGHKPLWQPLVPTGSGRLQAHEMAFDVARREGFNVFGEEHRQAGEWGHWTGRGMNWNSMCAHCHMTGFERGYDERSDSYRSTWVEQGVSCIQCHGPMPAGHGKNPKKTGAEQPPPAPFFGDRRKMMQTCAPCHARNELLTDRFQPGDNYNDHFRITLPVDPAVYYPDGQQRDEDFNWTSVLLSRMGHAGVTCLDCHDPHTTKTILPAATNQLCQQCHAAPGRELASGVRAVPIDPATHSHHAEGSPGNSCIACHMPTTNYMQRSPRHDHGWLKPDPLLTKELGIPNACSRCHEDKGLEWSIAKADEWYGAKLDSRQRERARAVAAAQAGRAGAGPKLADLLTREDIPAWRATYLSLLPGLNDADAGRDAATAALRADDPLERAAAARYFSGAPDASQKLTPLLKDPVRLVRLDAEWALSTQLAAGSPEREEFEAYLRLSSDQPAGRLRLGQELANRGKLPEALREIDLAVAWDPFSPGIRETQGALFAQMGKLIDAGNAYYRAAELSPDRAGYLALQSGLAFVEAGRLAEAENALRLGTRRQPEFARTWYNLGLLLAQSGRRPEALDALRQAMTHGPEEADYPYALATVLLQQGDEAGAKAAAERALHLDPNHAAARQLLNRWPR